MGRPNLFEIECLSCGKNIKPRQLTDAENYDTEHYDGQTICPECQSLLYVKTVKGKVQKTKLVNKFIPPAPAIKIVEVRMQDDAGPRMPDYCSK